MSMYGDYIKERLGDGIVETDKGFATYRYIDSTTVYIIDLYVASDYRKDGVASALADSIVEVAKIRGCTTLLGSVVPRANGSDDSMRVLLAYGMTPIRIEGQMVVFSKDIK